MHKKNEIQQIMEKNQLDAVLLYSDQNRYWYSNFRSSLGFLVITKSKSYLLLDGRYITAARESKNLTNIDELLTFQGNLWKMLEDILDKENVKKIGFEADWVIYNFAQGLQKNLPNQEWVGVDTSKVRMIKDADELASLQKACDITNEVFEAVLKETKPGMTEKELAIFVNNKFLEFGAEKLSFDTIVASGVNGSKPHAVPTDKKMVAGELVTLDMGCYYNGYASDQTRTFQLGTEIDPKMQDIYQTVYDAQSLGISLVRPGVKGKDIHDAVLNYINDHGYKGYFTHGLGHGYGIEIHEEPYVSPGGDEVLRPGMTITIEPGIYIPDLGGVRIEDDLVVTENGYELLTSSIRELQIIPN